MTLEQKIKQLQNKAFKEQQKYNPDWNKYKCLINQIKKLRGY